MELPEDARKTARNAELARLCRGRRRGRCRRPGRAPGRSRARPADGHSRHQPLFDLRRPASREARVVQVAETRPRAARRVRAHRAASAGTSCSPPTGRRRWPSTASFSAGRRRTPTSARWAPISCSPPAGRPSAACSPSPRRSRPLLALLFQRRRPRRGGAAREGRRRRDPRRPDRGAGRQLDRPVHGPAGRHVRAGGTCGAASLSDISSAPHRAILPTRAAGDGLGRPGRIEPRAGAHPDCQSMRRVRLRMPEAGSHFRDMRDLSRQPPARRGRAQIDRPGPRRGIRSPSSSRTDRYWCSRSRIRRAPCRSPSGRAFESTRRRPSE